MKPLFIKYKIALLIFIIIPFWGQSQQKAFDMLIDEPDMNVFIRDVIEDKQNNFILVGGDTDYTDLIPRLMKISPEGEIIFETDFGIVDVFFQDIYDIEDAYFITGKSLNRERFYFLKYDYDFNLIWQKEYNFFENDTLMFTMRSIINSDSDLVVTGCAGTNAFDDENMFTAKFNLEGDLLFFKYYPIQHNYQIVWDIDEIPDNSGYFITGYHFEEAYSCLECQIVELDENFEIINIQRILPENATYDGLWGNSSVTFFSDTTLLFASRKVLYDYPPQDEDINVQLLDTSLNLLKEVSWGKLDTIEYFPLIKGVDYMYKNAVYVGGISPYILSSATKNWNMLTKLDKNLSIMWTRFYGGDACYNLYNILAIKDGGALITGNRIKQDLPNYDTFIIKVDSTGNTTFTTGIKENIQNFTKDVIVYPNPTNGIINIQKGPQIKNARIDIYDITGKIIYHQEFTENQIIINLKGNKSGLYFYNIINKNKIIDTGKIVLVE